MQTVIDRSTNSASLAADYTAANHATELHALCEKYGVPACQLDAFQPQAEAIAAIPHQLATRWKVLPLARVGCVLTIAINNPLDLPAIDAARFFSGLVVEVVVASSSDLEAAIPRFYGVEAEAVEVELVEQEDAPQHEAVFNTRAEALVIAALDLPEVQRSLVRRSSLHKCFWVGSLENQPSCEQVFADALRAMEVGNRKAK